MSKTRTKKLTQMQSYVAGFIFSIILTLIPYYIVVNEKLTGNSLLFGLMGYAILQLVVQLVFFLHLGQEEGPKWNLISIIVMLAFMLIIGIGTLWIMKNLNYNIIDTPPEELRSKIIEDQNYSNYKEH